MPSVDDDTKGDMADVAPAALPPKMLTYYELDLGLNHMVRKWSEPVGTQSQLARLTE